MRSVHIHPLFHACVNISGPLQKPKLNEWKRYKIENMCKYAFITIHNVSRRFLFLTPPFLNPGKTDSTTGLWVQQTQSSKRKPQTQQAQVSANIEQSNTLSFNGCLRQISCFSNRSQSCGLQQDLHHKNTLLLPPCLARILRWSNRTIVSEATEATDAQVQRPDIPELPRAQYQPAIIQTRVKKNKSAKVSKWFLCPGWLWLGPSRWL